MIQEVTDNKELSTVASLLTNYSDAVNTDINVDDKVVLANYFKHVRNNTLLSLTTLALIQQKLKGGTELGINSNIAQTLADTLDRQTLKGLAKYPNTVNPTDYDLDGWLTHAIEELVDTTVYETCLIELLDE